MYGASLPTGATEHREISSRGSNPRHYSEAPQGPEQTADPALVTSRSPDKISALPRHISDAPAGSQVQPRPFQRMGRITTSDNNVVTAPELEARQQRRQQVGPLPAASASTQAPRYSQAAPAAAQLQSPYSPQAVASAGMLAAAAAAPATGAHQTQAAQLQLAVVAQPTSAAPAAGPAAGHMPANAAAGLATSGPLIYPTQFQAAPMQAHGMQYPGCRPAGPSWPHPNDAPRSHCNTYQHGSACTLPSAPSAAAAST